MMSTLHMLPRESSLGSALVACVLLAACGDSGGTTATGQGTDSDATGATSSSSTGDPTTTDVPTSATTDVPTSGITDSGSGTTSTTDTSTTDTSTAGTTTTGSSTTDTTDTTTDTTTGGVDDLPTSCLAADFPVDAPLCGADGPACALKRDEQVSAKLAFRNDMPALALRGDCGPALLYSEAVGGYFGFYGERTGADAWTVEPTPMPVATGSLEFDPAADQAHAVVDDGAFGVSLWQRSAGVWKQASKLAGMNHSRAPQLARDGDGVLHLGHIDATERALSETFDGKWTTTQVDKSADVHVRLALDAANKPRLTYWSSKEATWKLYFAAPPAAPELVTPLKSNVLDRPHTSLALAGPDMTPWVLAARHQADQLHYDLVLLHRMGPAKWAEETLIAENAAADKTCDFQPDSPGQQCNYDYVQLYPLGLVSAGAEVRAIYNAINYKGTLISQCMAMPFPICVWTPQSDTSTSELRIAWPGSAPDEHQVVTTDVFTDRATTRVDPGGNVHLGFYDQKPGTTDPIVRYLAFGP